MTWQNDVVILSSVQYLLTVESREQTTSAETADRLDGNCKGLAATVLSSRELKIMFILSPSYFLIILVLSPNVLAFSSRSMIGNGWLRAHQQSSLGASFLDELQNNIQTALNEALFKTSLKLPDQSGSSLATKTDALLAAIDEALLLGTPESEEAVRMQFKAIEASAPAPADLLDDPAKAAALDGEWRLRYTVAAFGAPGSGGSSANEASPQARGVQGSINATGIKVDTTGTGVITTQTFDLASSRVANDIVTPDGPLGLEVRLQVAGPYQRRYLDIVV